ncbi:hypothetical protein AYI69_g10321 [Smittium culicis]|uniref:Uncharacterized protein n=1 Tax=Smittium culicis TaxID=133412 RepID=A0A1R1X6H7_9FUNG|nr:hypothetical protein AYI69_g10321 [Smittium culicis]
MSTCVPTGLSDGLKIQKFSVKYQSFYGSITTISSIISTGVPFILLVFPSSICIAAYMIPFAQSIHLHPFLPATLLTLFVYGFHARLMTINFH